MSVGPLRAWRELRGRPLDLALAAAIIASAAYHLSLRWAPFHWLAGDGSFYFNVARGLIETGSLRQEALHPTSWYRLIEGWNLHLDPAWSNIALGADGEAWYPKHPVLLPLVATPFVFAFGVWGTLALNVITWCLVPWAVYLLGRRLGPHLLAALAALTLCWAPAYAKTAWSFSNDLFYTALLFWGLWAVQSQRPRLGGLLGGLAVAAKMTVIFLGPALLIPLAARRRWRQLAELCAAAALPGAALALSNTLLYGAPWVGGYQRILVVQAGELALHSHAEDFAWAALGPRLLELTADTLYAWPPLGLAALALGWGLARRDPLCASLGLIGALTLVFHAPYRWHRSDFLLPLYAAGAALLPVLAAGAPEPSLARPRPTWAWASALAAALALLTLVGAGRRLTAAEDPSLLGQLRALKVRLGETPCDYFNNRNQRWECSGWDRGLDLLMTGKVDWPAPIVGGTPRPMIGLSPHPSGRTREIALSLDGAPTRWELSAGFADRAHGSAVLEVATEHGPLLRWKVTGPVQARPLRLPEGAKTLFFRVEGGRAAGLLLDAAPRAEGPTSEGALPGLSPGEALEPPERG